MNEKIKEFILTCRKRYQVNCNACDMDKSIFHAELRKACEGNTCGNYGRCYVCPPWIGTPRESIKKVSSYQKIIVFQKCYPLEDGYDFEGMMTAKKQFQKIILHIAKSAKKVFQEPLILGAGGCNVCKKCAAALQEPCRHPDKAIQSLEANCIQVSELSALVNLPYSGGQNTVTYFGAVFLK